MYSYSGIHSIEHALCWLSIRPGHKRMQHCWMIHVACCWELLRKVWNRSNFYLRANVTNGRNKWLQQWPNNFGSCCIRLHVWSEVMGGSRNFLLGGGGPIFNSERTVELFLWQITSHRDDDVFLWTSAREVLLCEQRRTDHRRVHCKLKRSVSAPKFQFSPAGQSLVQPFLEPFEPNLGQKSSIKRLFQPTVGSISALEPNQP